MSKREKIGVLKRSLMQEEFEPKANFVKKQIEDDFKTLNEQELEHFFEKFKEDKRTLSFLE